MIVIDAEHETDPNRCSPFFFFLRLSRHCPFSLYRRQPALPPVVVLVFAFVVLQEAVHYSLMMRRQTDNNYDHRPVGNRLRALSVVAVVVVVVREYKRHGCQAIRLLALRLESMTTIPMKKKETVALRLLTLGALSPRS